MSLLMGETILSYALRRMYALGNIYVKAYIKNMTSQNVTLSVKSNAKFDMVRLFAALADRTRLRLLNLMDGGEVCVCYFVEILQEGQPKISRHLAYLRGAGIVRARRDGKWMHYSIERPGDTAAAAVLDAALASMKTDQQMLGDLQRLATACCGTQGLVWLVGAPVPAHGERLVGLK
jgi:ArsR family transcriptional regulator, arsenate/arsenite/antimonite-responsive transcriptional repressor